MPQTYTAAVYNVLFLCTGNSARSILAEALINHPPIGLGKFRGYSAGSKPKGHIHPMALDLLRQYHLPVGRLRSKSWDEFAAPDAPQMDFVITVCDQAAAEVCPVWPGQPVTGHWSVPDPAAVEGPEEVRRRAFREAHQALRRRIELFGALPFESLSRLALEGQLRNIGTSNRDQ